MLVNFEWKTVLWYDMTWHIYLGNAASNFYMRVNSMNQRFKYKSHYFLFLQISIAMLCLSVTMYNTQINRPSRRVYSIENDSKTTFK